MRCQVCLSLVAFVAADYVKAGVGNYTRYKGKNAFVGHGGTEIDSDATAPTGQSVASCEGRCNADSACDCVVLRLADGKCWKRGACTPSQFLRTPVYDVYVKGAAPAPTPTPGPTPSPSPSGTVSVTTLHWNVHRPCGTDNEACIKLAKQRLAQMASEVGASIVGAVELKDAPSALPGWQSSGMQCDSSAVMVAPGWAVNKSGGFCMNGIPVKGFAVALVTPPRAVRGCPQLCVMMGHVPHGSGAGVTGHSAIASVCGSVAGSCMIAMGDWNADDIGSRWESLVGGSPGLVDPHEITCCNCDEGFKFRFDHTATNIAGAVSAGHRVFDPQLTSFGRGCEHKPTSVHLQLPGAGPDASPNSSSYVYVFA